MIALGHYEHKRRAYEHYHDDYTAHFLIQHFTKLPDSIFYIETNEHWNLIDALDILEDGWGWQSWNHTEIIPNPNSCELFTSLRVMLFSRLQYDSHTT